MDSDRCRSFPYLSAIWGLIQVVRYMLLMYITQALICIGEYHKWQEKRRGRFWGLYSNITSKGYARRQIRIKPLDIKETWLSSGFSSLKDTRWRRLFFIRYLFTHSPKLSIPRRRSFGNEEVRCGGLVTRDKALTTTAWVPLAIFLLIINTLSTIALLWTPDVIENSRYLIFLFFTYSNAK